MLLQVEGLNVFYGEAVHALRDVCFEVDEGEIISIIGANGAGKSTLMWSLIGQLKPRSGKIIFNGKVMKSVAHTVVAAGMALVPERIRGLFEDRVARHEPQHNRPFRAQQPLRREPNRGGRENGAGDRRHRAGQASAGGAHDQLRLRWGRARPTVRDKCARWSE